MGEPPSGMGPGAITSPTNTNGNGMGGRFGVANDVNNSYDMAYGADPDPYGAVPPYTIGGYVNPTNPEGQGPSSRTPAVDPFAALNAFHTDPRSLLPHAHMPAGTYPAPFQTQNPTPAPTVNHLPGIGFSAAPSPMAQSRTPYNGYNTSNGWSSHTSSAYPQSPAPYPVFGQATTPSRPSNSNNGYLGPMGGFGIGRRQSTQAPIGTRAAPSEAQNRQPTFESTFAANGGMFPSSRAGPAASEFVPGVLNNAPFDTPAMDFHTSPMMQNPNADKGTANMNGDTTKGGA